MARVGWGMQLCSAQKQEKRANLWWIDDCSKGVHVVHAQIGDGESAATHLIWTQFALFSLQCVLLVSNSLARGYNVKQHHINLA